jgi:hypothetical protein
MCQGLLYLAGKSFLYTDHTDGTDFTDFYFFSVASGFFREIRVRFFPYLSKVTSAVIPQRISGSLSSKASLTV